MKKITYIFAAIMFLQASTVSAQGWTAPTSTPPGGNIASPINVGNVDQVKSAGLSVNAFTAYANAYFASSVGIAASPSGYALQVGNGSPSQVLARVYGAYGDVYLGPTNVSTYAGQNPAAILYDYGSYPFVIGHGGAQPVLFATNNTERMRITSVGDVGIGAPTPGYKLEVNGSVGAASFFYTSDRSLKKNIQPLTGSLSKITKLQGVSFDWKKDGTPSVGLIAQDVEKVYPELVNTSKTTGLKSVEYGNLVGPLIEAVKEQQKTIESQDKRIKALEEKVEMLTR